jgi:D-glycerate 3-kinase
VKKKGGQESLPDWQQAMLQQHQLPSSYLAAAQYWFDPLLDAIALHQSGAKRPLLIAVNGSQGSGKSTLCAYLEVAMASKHQLGVITLSLDDFYHTRQHRFELSQSVHPLLLTRGVPGTHDIELLNTCLDQLLDDKRSEPVAVPRFDKAMDDRRPAWETIEKNIDVVLLEGWCLGARPQPLDELVEPVNNLERSEDPDGVWRNYVNTRLAREFVPLYKRVDQWVMLQAPGFDCVYRWRLEQEQKLVGSVGLGKRVMDDAAVSRFIQFYQRLTELCLSELPDRVHHLYPLDAERQIQGYFNPVEFGF